MKEDQKVAERGQGTVPIATSLEAIGASGEVSGYPVRYARRRYGYQTYTWVSIWRDGTWVSLGDPWPCIVPKRSEIVECIALVLQGLCRGADNA